MQPSKPRAQTTPSAKCSRRRAGSVTRFLSSSRCSNSPRSTHDPFRAANRRLISQCAPLYPTIPHIATPRCDVRPTLCTPPKLRACRFCRGRMCGSTTRMRGGPARRPDPQLGQRQPPVAGAHRGTARSLPRARGEPLRLRRNHALARALEPQSLAARRSWCWPYARRPASPVRPRRSLLRRVGRAQERALLLGDARLRAWCCSSPIRSSCWSKLGNRAAAWLEIHGAAGRRDQAASPPATGPAPHSASPTTGSARARGMRMPDGRRAAFAEALAQNPHEWEAVMDEETAVEEYAAIAARTLVVSDPEPRAARSARSSRSSREACPGWSFRSLPEGGHMAPLTRPELVNPIVREFLDGLGQVASAADRRRSASAGGSGRRARRPCRPPRASGS